MKRKLIMMFILVVIISTSCVLIGCGNGDGDDTTVKYTVTFNANGGTLTGNETVSVDDGGLITGAPTAKRTGYTFDGWFLATSGGTAINLSTYKVTDNVTLYAQWTKDIEKYTVTFNANGGTLTGSGTVSVDDGGLITGAPTAKRPGFSFDGWFLAASGGTAINLTTYTVTGNVTLYAQWTQSTETYTLTLLNGCGVTFVGGGTTADIKEGDPMPSYEDNSGRTILGWYDVNNSTDMWDEESFSMPAEALEIAPYFTPANDAQAVVFGVGDGKTEAMPDRYADPKDFSYDNDYRSSVFSSVIDIVGSELGTLMMHSGTLYANEYFRMISGFGTKGTPAGITAGSRYTFQYNVANKGDAAITLEVIQLQNGSDLELSHGVVKSGDLAIDPGDTESFAIDITLTSDNANALTVFRLKQDVENMRLGVSLSKINDVVLDTNKKYTVTLASGSGVTFAGGGTTAELVEGEALPTIVNGTAGVIAGWYGDNNNRCAWTASEFRMPSSDVTLTPFFQKPSGFLDLVPLSQQSAGKPNSLVNVVEANFITNGSRDVNNVAVRGGAGANVEIGKLLRYNGEMPNGAEFRMSTVVDNNTAIVKKNVAHTFRYNFENNGAEVIDLMLYQVNDGKNIEEGDNGHRIFLQPGESMAIEFSISFARGNDNKNAQTFFKANADMSKMSIGISMSIKIGT